MITAVKADEIEEIEKMIALFRAKITELSILRQELKKEKPERYLYIVR